MQKESPNVRFVLCEPGHPGNIGSAARAVKTMGFRELWVVNPQSYEYKTDEEAIAYATSSVDVLQESRCVATLAEALEGVTFAWAMTGYDREFGPRMSHLKDACRESAAWISEGKGAVAFVFGTERTGLSNAHVMMCQGCAAIKADPESSSLNLAQAVQIAAYEMFGALDEKNGTQAEFYGWQKRFADDEMVGVDEMEGFYAHWERAMEAIGVHNPERPKHLMDMTRRIFSRSMLSRSELDLMRGIASAIIKRKSDRAGTKVKAGRKSSGECTKAETK